MGQILKKSTRKVVKWLLQNTEKAKDSDRYILCCIWHREAERLKIATLKDFFTAYNNGKLTHSESVTRCRRKLQELHPELRGKTYNHRQEELEPQVRDELKTFEDEN